MLAVRAIRITPSPSIVTALAPASLAARTARAISACVTLTRAAAFSSPVVQGACEFPSAHANGPQGKPKERLTKALDYWRRLAGQLGVEIGRTLTPSNDTVPGMIVGLSLASARIFPAASIGRGCNRDGCRFSRGSTNSSVRIGQTTAGNEVRSRRIDISVALGMLTVCEAAPRHDRRRNKAAIASWFVVIE